MVIATAITVQHQSAHLSLGYIINKHGSTTRCLARKKELHGKNQSDKMDCRTHTHAHTPFHPKVYIFPVPSCLSCHLFCLMFVCLQFLLVLVFLVFKPGLCVAYAWFAEGSRALCGCRRVVPCSSKTRIFKNSGDYASG